MLLVGSAVSFALGLGFFGCYKHYGHSAEILESTRVVSLREIKNLLGSGGVDSQYVIVTGMTSARVEEGAGGSGVLQHPALKTQYVKPQQECAIYSLVIKEHVSEWKSSTRTWHDFTRKVSSTTTSIPFSLADRAGQLAAIQEPLRSPYLSLQIVYDKFIPKESSTSGALLDWASGEKSRGFQHTERILPLKKPILVAGEAILLEGSRISIREPIGLNMKGYPFVVSTSDLPSIIQQERRAQVAFKWLAVAFGVLGLVLLFVKARQYFKERARAESSRRAIEDFENMGPSGSNPPGEDDAVQCIICYCRPRNAVVLECGHMFTCLPCARALEDCPVCRGRISRIVQAFH
eukprot:Nk52_evm25s156 gene=Nk52_evmTU25s156